MHISLAEYRELEPAEALAWQRAGGKLLKAERSEAWDRTELLARASGARIM